MKQIEELKRTGLTFVLFSELQEFKTNCRKMGLLINGGAFDVDGKGQYFYID